MRPFNLQEALEGKPVVTRSGKPVTDIKHLPSAKDYPVAAVIEGEMKTFTERGTLLLSFDSETPLDLFMAPKPKVKKTGYVAVYPSGLYAAYCNHRIYRTEQEAADNQEADNKELKTGPLCIAKVEWEEEDA